MPSQGDLNQKCCKYIKSVLENIQKNDKLNSDKKIHLEKIVDNFEQDYNANSQYTGSGGGLGYNKPELM